MLLKVEFLAVGSAVCTHMVIRLAILHRRFDRKRDNAGTQFSKLIPALISFPVFPAEPPLFQDRRRFTTPWRATERL
jgi:hypothetical protein